MVKHDYIAAIRTLNKKSGHTRTISLKQVVHKSKEINQVSHQLGFLILSKKR